MSVPLSAVFAAVPGVAAAAVLLAARRRAAERLSPRAVAVVSGAWTVGVLALLAGPLLALYTYWTGAGRLDAPAPGAGGFAAARLLLTVGGAAVLVGIAAYAVDLRTAASE